MTDRINNFISTLLKDDRSRYITIGTSTTLLLLTAWTIHDRHRWTSLDTGGLPPTWSGYIKTATLRILRLFKGGQLKDHTRLKHTGPKYLRDSLAPRQGPRPPIREWPIPQRQETIPIDPAVHARIHSWTEKFATDNPEILEYRLSNAEGMSAMAVYAKPDLSTRNPEAEDWLLGNEIFHAHPEDSSLHVWLSEADLKGVVSRRWGTRFPLSAMGVTAAGYGFVYAPRTMEECDVVEEIIRAGIEFVTGRKPV